MPAPGDTILYVRCADDADESARVYAFTAAPSNSLGADGDMAIIVAAGSSKLQQKIGGAWTDVAGGGGGGVSSVFGRSGAVIAVSGDYTSTLVTNSSTVAGATVTNALNTLNVQWVPTGGAKGELLLKSSGTNYDAAWSAIPQLSNQTADPAAADADYTRVHIRRAGLPWLASTSNIGGTVLYDRMLGTVSQTVIAPNTTTTLTVLGNSVTSVGTISHPTPTVTYGWMANFATAASANATAGTGNSATPWARGSATSNAAGFFYVARIGLPDASYNESGASTGSRIFAGLTNQTMATMVGADNPAGHYCGFARRSVNAGAIDTNWRFFTKDNVTLNPVDTGMAFAAAQTYVLYIYCATADSTIYWRIDNITAGTTAAGSTTSNLPGTTTYMRAGIQLGTINATARNIRLALLKCEEAH